MLECILPEHHFCFHLSCFHHFWWLNIIYLYVEPPIKIVANHPFFFPFVPVLSGRMPNFKRQVRRSERRKRRCRYARGRGVLPPREATHQQAIHQPIIKYYSLRSNWVWLLVTQAIHTIMLVIITNSSLFNFPFVIVGLAYPTPQVVWLLDLGSEPFPVYSGAPRSLPPGSGLASPAMRHRIIVSRDGGVDHRVIGCHRHSWSYTINSNNHHDPSPMNHNQPL